MNIIPVKTEYFFESMGHTFRAVVEHIDSTRKITYYYNDHSFLERTVDDGGIITDDDNVCNEAIQYFEQHANVMSDLFMNHTEKIGLTKKIITCVLENFGYPLNTVVIEEKNYVTVKIVTGDGEDTFSARLHMENVSEALEKLRMFTGVLESISNTMSDNISELSNDMVMSHIDWK